MFNLAVNPFATSRILNQSMLQSFLFLIVKTHLQPIEHLPPTRRFPSGCVVIFHILFSFNAQILSSIETFHIVRASCMDLGICFYPNLPQKSSTY